MPLSRSSLSVMLSIFKGVRNGRCKVDWKDFNQAMRELGFEVTQTGVALSYAVPPRWGAGVLVLHMAHDHKMQRSQQNYVKRRLARAFGWKAATFLEENLF